VNGTAEPVSRAAQLSADIKLIALCSEPRYIADAMHSEPAITQQTIEPSKTILTKRNQAHWGMIALVALESLCCDIYFPEWRLTVIATSMPAAFLIAVLKKLYGRAGFWMLLPAFTVFFWLINARMRTWINALGILSLALVGGVEMIALAAVVVRVYPEAKKR